MSKIIAFVLMMFCALNINAQSYTRQGTVYTATTETQKSTAKKTQFTWKEKDKEYPIYLSKNNKAFIIKTSKKTGKEYRKYLPDEVAKDILKQL